MVTKTNYTKMLCSSTTIALAHPLQYEPKRGTRTRITSPHSSRRDFKMATQVLCVILIVFQVAYGSEEYRNDGLMDRLTSGMKFAQNLLGMF